MPILPGSDTKLGGKFIQRVEANDPLAIWRGKWASGSAMTHIFVYIYVSEGDPCRKTAPTLCQTDWGSMFWEGMPTLTPLMNEEGIDGSTKLTTLMEIGEKDERKEMHHLEKAAICGHIEAR